jgi:site-specific DNA-cytosine methylase
MPSRAALAFRSRALAAVRWSSSRAARTAATSKAARSSVSTSHSQVSRHCRLGALLFPGSRAMTPRRSSWAKRRLVVAWLVDGTAATSSASVASPSDRRRRSAAECGPDFAPVALEERKGSALVHPDELRCLSVEECATLQTFSPEVIFEGTDRSQYQQIGNAVPPRLARALGEQVRSFLAGTRLPVPPVPLWRQLSANRRIGTHGWACRCGLRRRRNLERRRAPRSRLALRGGCS